METFPVWICEEIVAGYRERGLASLFRWQAEVLSDASLRAPHYANLLFSAPTSAGKTVVAELIAVNTVLTTKRKALFIFPYVSVAREKFIALQKLWRSVNLRVRAYIGACSAPLDCWDAAVCTIEKANSLLNRATEEGTLEDIGVVVVDEFHMIFDSNRGQIIEHMVAKLLYASAYLSHHVQIIAMSATISNLAEIADWLKAHQFETHFRPVELEEGILIGKTICDVQTLLPLRSISSRFELPADPERIIQLCMESLSLGDSVLIFCSSKAETEKVATMVSNHLRELLSEEPQQDFNHMLKIDALSFFVEYFQNETQSSDEILLTTIPTGVAFHHAGLTMEEREAVEDGFRAGVLRILVATSTLSSGVNLPAQRVIIKAQLSGPSALTNIAYRQMVGRAGRLGQSSKGESIVVCREQQLDAVKRVLQRMPLRVSRSSLKRARLKLIVEAVCSGLCGSDVKLSHLLQLTYFEGLTGLEDELEWLISKRLLALQKDGSDVLLRGTQLGRAVLSSSLPPDIALLVYADLERASRALILDNELHLLYLVTPLNNTAVWTGFLDWSHYYTIWSKLPHQLQRVGQMVGVSERFLLEKMRGRVTASSADVQVHLRFISALALFELINERPLITVARRFRINRGALQSLRQQSATYACMVVAFCERLGWVYLRSILDGFSERLAFGVRRELTELVKLLGMDARRARAFHERRITTIASLATTPIEQIAKILRSAVPFVARNGDRAGLNRWLSGEKAMTDLDAATLLAARARQYLASSVRGLGVFSETQLSLLMSTTTDEGMGQRESSCETSTNKANSVLSSKVDNAKQENSVLDQSLLELSACDLFDHSSIYGEECFDEQLLYASQSDNESKNPAKEFAQRNSSSIEHERVFVDEEQQMNQDKENYPPNNVVSDDETNVEKIMKKMSRTSISSSNVQPLASLFTSKSKIRSPRRSSIEMAIKGDGCNKEVDDGSCISTLLDECLGENEENYIPENDKSCILEDKKANIHKNKQFRSRETGGLGLPENERGTLVDLVAVEEKDERTERAEVTVENSKLEWSISDSALYACMSHNQSTLESITFSATTGIEYMSANDSISDSVLLAALPYQSEANLNGIRSNVEQREDCQCVMANTMPAEKCLTYCSKNLKTNGSSVERNLYSLADFTPLELESRDDVCRTATIDNTRVKNNGIQTNANGQLGVGQEIGDKEIPSSEEEQQTLGLFDASGDLFEASKSSSLASETPQDVRVKRARQCGSIGSPLSPNCRSPLLKFVKLSSPCSTSSPLTFPDTSSPHSLKKNFSPLAKVDGTYTKTPSRRGEAIRLKMSQDVKGEANSERSRNFVIDDVCRSHSRWLSFTEEVRSWSEIGVGIWLGRHTSRNEVDVIAVALCASDGKPAFIPFDDSCIYGNDREEADFPSCTPVDSISVAERIALFESVLASTEQRKILFDLLAATRALNSPTFSFDLIINRLSNCVCIKTLSFLAHFRTADGESPLTFHELITRVMPSVSVSNIWKAGCSNGRIISSTYAFVNVRLYEYLMPLAIRLSSERSVTLELDSIMLLARLEATGIAFDRKTANDLVEKMKKELSLLEEEGRRLAGIPFNFESPSEIANVLFVRMCIPPVGATGGNSCIGRRHYSTNKNVLHQLAKQHPIAGVILKWRKLNTALSSSLHNLLRLCKSDDRIHCSFTAFSPTGRVQSVNPNVQNVQKDALISSLSVRSLFVAPPGYVLVSADYCQLELRVLAGLSRDPALNELFCSGGDLFEIMADRWNADSSTGITVDRQKMKQLCYAIIYGMGATSLGEQIGVSKQTAQHFIDSFFKKFAKVRSWIDAILERCHQDRCSVTVMGRRRPLKDANSSIQNDRAKAERQAVNSTIQGSASEIFKLALLRLERSLKGVDARIVMQVHDEVIVEVGQASLAIAVERIRNAMCSALPEFPIPLTVKISSGMSWGDLSLMDT